MSPVPLRDRLNIDLTLSNTFTDQPFTDFGVTAAVLSELDTGDYGYFNPFHDFFTQQDLVINTAAGGAGYELIEDTDYTLSEENTSLSARLTDAQGSTYNVYKKIQITNPTYQTGTLYFSGEWVGDDNDSTDQNQLIDVVIKQGYNSLNNFSSGPETLASLTTGVRNLAIGYQALKATTNGSDNTAIGYQSLAVNVGGDNNFAIGYQALTANTAGNNNIGIGYKVLAANVGANSNVAMGYQALTANVVGANNVAIGDSAMVANVTGSSCVAVGYLALAANTTATNNIAIGAQAMRNNTVGTQNIGIGQNALYTNTTGIKNTCLGQSAGYSITTGSNLTCLGYSAEPTAATATNQVTLGDANVTTLRCAVTTITAISDMRDKEDIEDLTLGLDFINKLRPVQFHFDRRQDYLDEKDRNDNKKLKLVKKDGSRKSKKLSAGFIAQELKEVQGWLDLVLEDNPDKLETADGKILPVLVKAVQELSAKVAELEKAGK